ESIRHADGRSWIVIDERIHTACLEFQDYRDVVEGNGVRWGQEPEDVAITVGIDPVGLRGTVNRARAAAAGGEDEFGRSFWEEPLTKPLGAIHVVPALFHTQGGLKTDEKARVLRQEVSLIDGLHAAGGAAAGNSGHGDRRYLAGNG